MKLRIAILRSDDAHHDYLAALLQSRFDVVAHVVEPGDRQRARVRKSRRWVDYGYTIYHRARRAALGLDAYRRGYFGDPPPVLRGACNPVIVDWINDPEVPRLLAAARPDLTVIICTSILRPEVIEAAGGPIINVHGGCLPRYRGNHCFFFALYNGDFDNIGSTIHFVDRGIDTGDIIEVVRPAIHADDSAERLYCRAEKMAIHRLVELLEDLERGRPLPRRAHGMRAALHRTRDRKPYHDVALWLRRKAGLLVVPERPAPARQPDGGAAAPDRPAAPRQGEDGVSAPFRSGIS